MVQHLLERIINVKPRNSKIEHTGFPQHYLVDFHRIAVAVHIRRVDFHAETHLLLPPAAGKPDGNHVGLGYHLLESLLAIAVAAYQEELQRPYVQALRLHFHHESQFCRILLSRRVVDQRVVGCLHADYHQIVGHRQS